MTNKTEIALGKVIEGEFEKDAIHIALVPVVSNEQLAPGQSVRLFQDSQKVVESFVSGAIGIVDPFLTGLVYPGQKFWMMLFPNTITSLRHDWTHPAFTDNSNKEDEVIISDLEHRIEDLLEQNRSLSEQVDYLEDNSYGCAC